MTNPLSVLSLDELRRRTSAKWRHFDADVLPLWVAEMDVPLAESIVAAVEHAVAIGATGLLVICALWTLLPGRASGDGVELADYATHLSWTP